VIKKIYVSNPFDNKEIEALFIFPRIRFKAYKFWFLELTGNDKTSIEDYVIELLDYTRINYSKPDQSIKKLYFKL
jgi:hypothetical protein